MPDDVTSNRDPGTETDGAAVTPAPTCEFLQLSGALIRALSQYAPSDAPLCADNVPAAVLALPIDLLIEELIRHVKKFRDPHWNTMPMSLRRFRHMRADTLRKKRSEIHSVLWAEPDHHLVNSVREKILSQHADLAAELSSGELFSAETLAERLSDLGPNGTRIMAAVLWASGLKGASEELFRILVPFVHDASVSSRATGRPSRTAPEQSPLKSKLRKEQKAHRQKKQRVEELERVLQSKERKIEDMKSELETVQTLNKKTVEQRNALQQSIADAHQQYKEAEQRATKATKVNTTLRRDITQVRDNQKELEVTRSALAGSLAAKNTEVEHLKQRIASIPLGLDAVWQWLCNENERISTNRFIAAGADRQRADHDWTIHRKLQKQFLDAHPEYQQSRPVVLMPKSELRLTTFGGAAEIGKSCYLIELANNRVLVDCGIKPSDSEDLHPDLENLGRVDALLLTHAHTDHIGWVPALVNLYPDLDIYCSEETAALLPVMLDDCNRHYVRKMTILRERAQYMADADVMPDAYERADVHRVSDLARSCIFGQEVIIGNLQIRFYKAGHILGASSILIEDQSGRQVFISGDFSSFPQLTVSEAIWPQELQEIDLLVLESTYGKTDHQPLDDSRAELVSFVRNTINDGSVILASFGLGRAQELLTLLSDAMDNEDLPRDVPVYIDGMIRRINPIYAKFSNFSTAENFYEVSGDAERKEVASITQHRPSIIVTTSGMLAGGPIVEYARCLLPDPRHRIVLTGYQDEGAPSNALRGLTKFGKHARKVRVHGEDGKVIEFEAAMHAKTVGLSAHADQSGLIKYAQSLKPRHVVLVHGEPEAQTCLRRKLLRVCPGTQVRCGPSEYQVP